MKHQSKYTAKPTDKDGFIDWSATEKDTWRRLFDRQFNLIQSHACDEYLSGIKTLALDNNAPQLPAINKKLEALTGWKVTPVPALIDFDTFFALLANREFPAATFIRTPQEFDYVTEPDIFHEIFGHCPLLTNPYFAEFTHQYGLLGKKLAHKDRVLLARLYWYTVEFGLVGTPQGTKIYGGGILSSPSETAHAMSKSSIKKPFDIFDALAQTYRIDKLQPSYFVIQDLKALFDIQIENLPKLIKIVRNNAK